MKYRIFIIKYYTPEITTWDVELHNIERENNPTNLCFMKIKEDISFHLEAKAIADKLQIVLGHDVSEIIEASGRK